VKACTLTPGSGPGQALPPPSISRVRVTRFSLSGSIRRAPQALFSLSRWERA